MRRWALAWLSKDRLRTVSNCSASISTRNRRRCWRITSFRSKTKWTQFFRSSLERKSPCLTTSISLSKGSLLWPRNTLDRIRSTSSSIYFSLPGGPRSRPWGWQARLPWTASLQNTTWTSRCSWPTTFTPPKMRHTSSSKTCSSLCTSNTMQSMAQAKLKHMRGIHSMSSRKFGTLPASRFRRCCWRCTMPTTTWKSLINTSILTPGIRFS
jgi:hypothetical protein